MALLNSPRGAILGNLSPTEEKFHMVVIDVAGLLLLFLPIYLVWQHFQKSAREKSLEDFLRSSKSICWIGIAIALVLTELWPLAIVAFIIGAVMGKGKNPVKDGADQALTNMLIGIWKKAHPEIQPGAGQ